MARAKVIVLAAYVGMLVVCFLLGWLLGWPAVPVGGLLGFIVGRVLAAFLLRHRPGEAGRDRVREEHWF